MNEESTAKPKYTKTLSMVSNKPDGKEYKITLSNKLYWTLVLVVCVLAGIVIGFFTFGSMEIVHITNEKIMQNQAYLDLQDQHAELKFQYDELTIVNENLADQVQVLSDTINKNALEDEAAALLDAESRVPSGFPVTGSVTEAEAPKEDTNSEKAVYFEAAENSTVVAAAVGQVVSVRKNVYDYYEIRIDHGNDYISVFTNKGYPLIEVGITVLKGTPLFLIQEDNTLVKYQISYLGEMVDVYSVMSIEG